MKYICDTILENKVIDIQCTNVQNNYFKIINIYYFYFFSCWKVLTLTYRRYVTRRFICRCSQIEQYYCTCMRYYLKQFYINFRFGCCIASLYCTLQCNGEFHSNSIFLIVNLFWSQNWKVVFELFLQSDFSCYIHIPIDYQRHFKLNIETRFPSTLYSTLVLILFQKKVFSELAD